MISDTRRSLTILFSNEDTVRLPFVKITYINARSGFPEPICLVNQIAKNLSVME